MNVHHIQLLYRKVTLTRILNIDENLIKFDLYEQFEYFIINIK